jgi:hypothetical protein
LNDSTLKNVHWALCTGVFGKRDVGRIEREYLDVLNFELKISEDDLLAHHDGLSEVITHLSHSPRSAVARETEISLSTFPIPPTHQHTERRHTRRRTSTTTPHKVSHRVPELSPSSTDSDDSVSPRTPSEVSMVVSPPVTVKKPQQFLHTQSQHLLPPPSQNVSKSRNILDLFPSIPKSSWLTT